MLTALGTLVSETVVSKTLDLLLTMNSSEARRRKFGKELFTIYTALDDVVQSLAGIEAEVRVVAKIDRYHDGDYLDSRRNQPVADGDPLSREIRALVVAFGKLARVMEIESWDLHRRQPTKLKAIGIFDDEIVEVFRRAWISDGGFVQALHSLRLDQEIDGKVLKLVDAEFDPKAPGNGGIYAPRKMNVTMFTLKKRRDALAFLELTAQCKHAVSEARNTVKKFIAKNCKIEDVL